MSTLILDGCAIVTMDAHRSEHTTGHVVVTGNRITAVGPGPAPGPAGEPGPDPGPAAIRKIDAAGCLVTPGLVNTHHHLYQWATRGMAPDATLFEWLTALYPVWAAMDADMVRVAATAALGWLARTGCTTTMDHHYVFPRTGGDVLRSTITAAADVGLRFHPTRGSMDLGASSGGLPPDAVVESRDEILAATQAAIEEFHDPAPDSMLRMGVAPCSPFSVTGALMAESAELARRAGVRMHTHLAETADETQFCAERFGCTPVEYVDSLGWLGDDVWLAHAVHLDDAAIARLAATGTGVAHCPSSNGRLGAGVCRVPALLAAGVPVGLGVDGAASQEASSLVAEIRQAALTARAAGGPRALSVRRALELATIGGASLLGWQDQIGSVEPGKLADIALWRLDQLPHAGIADPVAALVLGSPPPLELLLVNGRPVVERDRLVTVDEDTTAAAARAVSERLAGPARSGPAHAAAARGGRLVSTPPRLPVRAPARPATRPEIIPGGVGESPLRPDGALKVTGQFAYGSDLWAEDMIWGATLRSPHPFARITGLDIGPALATAGVYAVLTHEDVPGLNRCGLEHADQPVLADDVVRYQGEPVALVAADHPEIARRAAAKIRVGYEVLSPVTDAVSALADGAPQLHPDGNLVRHLKLRKGAAKPAADVVVTGNYRIGMQDQAFLGPEAGLAVPDGDGGVDLYVATQWLHVDQRQICAALGLPPEKVRLTLAGVGGAFGGREDLSMHVHACLLALRTGKPVKMMYNREESFFGHVHRHPATMRFEHGATRDGRLVYVTAEIWLDGGAYASSTPAVVGNAGTMGIGPYIVPNVHVDTYGVYTNNPPCGAMRGFGSVQAAFGYEAQMDKLAAALGLDPVELRCRNAMELGCEAPTGQIVDSPAPVAELLRTVRDMPLPPASTAADGSAAGRSAAGEARYDLRELPGGVANTTHGEGVRRGVGYAVAYKNVGFSEGFDDYSIARVRLEIAGGEPTVGVRTAAAEVGQGLVTIEQQICRTELGVQNVVSYPKDTSVGSGGSTSASRQTYVTGGAIQAACQQIRERVFAMTQRRLGRTVADLRMEDGSVTSRQLDLRLPLAELLAAEAVEETAEWRHRRTYPVDPETGQGFAHVQYAFSAHRAVVDVDTELGLVRVVSLDCAQDVGKAMNPDAVLGQIHGGSAQGLGLAVMEEIQVHAGQIRNPSFTDYLIPTIADMPPQQVAVFEYPDPHAPYGLRGVGEPPTISSGPAVAAAIRAATGLDLTRIPVRPEHITGTAND